jgi:hypothetical protein
MRNRVQGSGFRVEEPIQDTGFRMHDAGSVGSVFILHPESCIQNHHHHNSLAPVTITFTSDIGTRTFQPRFMSWS